MADKGENRMTEEEYKEEIARLRDKLRKARKEKKRWRNRYLELQKEVDLMTQKSLDLSDIKPTHELILTLRNALTDKRGRN